MTQKKEAFYSVRKIALDLLIEIMEKEAFCDKCLHQALDTYDLEQRDKGFLMRLVEGTVERCIELDYVIDQFSKVKVKKMKPVIRNILRMACYQIFYMDQIPDSAACNEAVKLTIKRKMHNLKGFINGVLRTVIRQKDRIVYPKEGTKEYLHIRYSMPEWIVVLFIEQYGINETEQILQSFLTEKKALAVRLTTSCYSKEEIIQTLLQDHVTVKEASFAKEAVLLQNYKDMTKLAAFQKGMFQVQDESSMLVGMISGIKKSDTVIDICAAPGGKTLHAADLLAGSGQVLSADLTKEKTDLIQQNCQRLGYQNVSVFQNDALVYKEEWKEKADVLIADLPCSGLGVIGKKCDIKYKTKSEDIKILASLQKEILKNAVSYVKPGGRLLFSTCTIAQEENEKNVAWIQENLPLRLVSIEEDLPEKLQQKTGEKGYLQVLPTMAQTDGFFVSCFEKTI